MSNDQLEAMRREIARARNRIARRLQAIRWHDRLEDDWVLRCDNPELERHDQELVGAVA